MFKYIFAFGVLAFFGSPTIAQTHVGKCSTLSLRTVPVGTQCKSSKGVLFELVSRGTSSLLSSEESWKDVSSGITWHDNLRGTYNQYQALNQCIKVFHQGLPTIDQFAAAEKHGFREVLPHFQQHGLRDETWYWSSSPRDDVEGKKYAYIFDASAGDSYTYSDDRTLHYLARCIDYLK